MQCPSCGKELKFSDSQRAKIDQALQQLPEGKTLKLTCPQCRNPFVLDRNGRPAAGKPPVTAAGGKAVIAPPAPPDVSWLETGEFSSNEVIEDVPLAMILIRNEICKNLVNESFAELGYQPVFFDTPDEAIDRMRFASFNAIALHVDFEGRSFEESLFHRHMCQMAMARRRYIYYVLIGPNLHTLYDLQALSLSANLVVNDRDAGKLNIILRKGLADYEELFGPYLAALQEYGKK